MKQDNVDRFVTEQDRTFVPDRSWLADGPGAVSMQLRVGKYLFLIYLLTVERRII